MKDAERRAQLVSLWLKRPVGKRTDQDVFIFCMELHQTHPHLLHGPGDECNQVRVDLHGYIEE
jgi:hypothetical protein